MGASDLAAAYMNRGHDHLIGREFFHQHTDCCNIRNRIHRADLVEMDLRNRDTMCMAFRFCQQCINCHHILLNSIGNGEMIPNNTRNIMQPAVLVMTVIVVVIVTFLFLAIHRYGNMGAHNTTFDRRFFFYMNTR